MERKKAEKFGTERRACITLYAFRIVIYGSALQLSLVIQGTYYIYLEIVYHQHHYLSRPWGDDWDYLL